MCVVCCLLYRHTHELKLHQLLVRVCGWEQVKPVSVDKVGVFFRYAAADRNNSSNTVSQKPPVLIFFPRVDWLFISWQRYISVQ